MSGNAPRVLTRRTTVVSPWVSLIEKQVQFDADRVEVYHSVVQADYVAVLAVTGKGLVPIVKQYRPAVEAFTWEFPAGTLDDGEEPLHAAARELLEETGLRATSLHPIGAYYPDTGRLSVRSTGFFATCGDPADARSPEPGIELRFVTLGELLHMVKSDEFNHQLHIALIVSAAAHGHITL